jgi:hypothetical protein
LAKVPVDARTAPIGDAAVVRGLRLKRGRVRASHRERGGSVEQARDTGDTPERREASAEHVLAAYRERRRRRRDEDTYFGSEELIFDPAAAATQGEPVAMPDAERRRSEIMDDAEAEGMPPELAALLYDIAQEEGLDPGLAFELVRTGLGVAPPADGVSTASDAPAVDKYLPPWMFPPEPTDHMLRERMLRVSFRRLRGILGEEGDPDAALRRFALEPDVGHYGY